ncbi:UDP-glucose 4-epimerase GalE [Bosea sp. RCC_152_1]|uniref:UDP-glucose 4-epimerase GalE n=1 Tax=Bosea sp. RCC_152_1 TaxID=3239228 RepID=UPI003523F4CB
MKSVLVTGGAGYIGSHVCKQLSLRGFEPVAFDNLVHGHADCVKWGPLIEGDIHDRDALSDTLARYRPAAVVHLAAYAYVGESVSDPLKYYSNNVSGTISLLGSLQSHGVSKFVFSSTCATYGIPDVIPISEDTRQEPINPYGQSKLMIEKILADLARASDFSYVALRYFNASGADPDGELAERHDPETHLIPRALMAAGGTIPELQVFGDDYPTPDGTCLRDYIHVTDLAEAHVRALDYLENGGANICLNLGTGKPLSVNEIMTAIERVTGRRVPVAIQPRRTGDPAALSAEGALAERVLGFSPTHSDIDTIVKTAWASFKPAT